MRHASHRLSTFLAVAVLAASPLGAQIENSSVLTAPTYTSLTFGSGASARSVSQLALPVVLILPFGEKISVDVRLLCATLRPLEDEIAAGRFRADLYYRIQGIQLEVPPLRERREDLQLLIKQILQQLEAKHGTRPVRMTRGALAALRRHPWPGNIRELRNVLELVAVLRSGKSVRQRDLPPSIGSRAPERPRTRSGAAAIEVSLDQPLRRSIGQIIEAALELEGGNRTLAARRLGISARTIQRHLLSQ